MSSSVDQYVLRYYKYDLRNSSGRQAIQLKNLRGQAALYVSLKEKNPRNSSMTSDFCEDSNGNNTKSIRNVHSFHSDLQLESLKEEGTIFCTKYPSGAVTPPLELPTKESIVINGMLCSSRWLYVAVEGLDVINEYNLTLMHGMMGDIEKVNVKPT